MQLLVSTRWLSDNLGETVILDASAHLPSAGRDPRAEFLDQHIPTARFLGLPSLKDEGSSVPSALPNPDQFAERMRELGVSSNDRIVLYDHSLLRSAARAFFMFRMFGFEQIAILDGGFEKWLQEDRGTAEGLAPIAPSDFTAAVDDRSLVRSKQEIAANCAAKSEQVVDARDAGRFTGEIEDAVHGLAGGHIPGARNLHYLRLLNADRTFKSPAALRAIFDEAGIDLEQPVVASCGSGMTASVVLFAMQLLGKEGALYDGSWGEWGADPETPKEMGEAG